MKRIFALLICAALLTGCGAASNASPGTDAVSTAASAVTDPVITEPVISTGEPLSGTEKTDGTSWRPVAVMVNNSASAAARQWGTADASVVVEALTEGKSTNLMLWYPSVGAVPKVGPVAQGKDIFWQFALPENSVVVEKGANTYAKNLLNCYAWQPIDALYTGVTVFDFDASDPAAVDENCWFTQGASLQNGLNTYGMAADGTVPYLFSFSDAPTASGNGAVSVKIGYSDQSATILTLTNGVWEMCHADTSAYLDANNGVQPSFANVLVLYAAAGVKDDGFTRDYNMTSGSGLYFVNDTWQAITWQKGDAGAPLLLFAADGTALQVARGKTYMGVYGGFAGQYLTVTGADGAQIDTGVIPVVPEPVVVPTEAPTAVPVEAPADAPAADVPASVPAV